MQICFSVFQYLTVYSLYWNHVGFNLIFRGKEKKKSFCAQTLLSENSHYYLNDILFHNIRLIIN